MLFKYCHFRPHIVFLCVSQALVSIKMKDIVSVLFSYAYFTTVLPVLLKCMFTEGKIGTIISSLHLLNMSVVSICISVEPFHIARETFTIFSSGLSTRTLNKYVRKEVMTV